MTPVSGAILSLAYIFGLLIAGMVWAKYVLFVVGCVAAIVMPAFWRTGPRSRIWLAAGAISLLAVFYLQLRQPQPTLDDISTHVAPANQEQLVTVQGKVASIPRLTRNQEAQFWFEARRLSEVEGKDGPAEMGRLATGKLYVTLPLLRATGLKPGQPISVTGFLYKPKPAANPGGFDFRSYLARQGAFAGLKGRQIRLPDEDEKSRKQWAWWRIRQRVIRAQVRWLGSPAGLLVSSMVMGRRSVDLPYDLRDQFIQVGLAHTLAASGFHVSLVLGAILTLTRWRSRRVRLALGTLALVVFAGLTGFQPSVLRATLMGFAALVALLAERPVKPLGTLLMAAVLLLVFNPLWIWDLGFQFSFLATLGLIVTAPTLAKWLDWLPSPIASLVAVTLGAALWTLPLQLYVFGLVTPYSILANIITAPLIIIISIGGMLSGLTALIWPVLGSVLAWLLFLPVHGLLKLVNLLTDLPGSSIAIGNISLAQTVVLYGLMVAFWLRPQWRKRAWLAVLLAMGLIFIPIWQTQSTLYRATVLATSDEPILVIQQQRQVTLINSGDINTVRFTVLPFLQQQGVNQIDWVISTNSRLDASSGWKELLKHLPIANFYDGSAILDRAAVRPSLAQAVRSRKGNYKTLQIGQAIQIGSTTCKLIVAKPAVLQLQIDGQLWLLLGNLKPDRQKQLAITGRLPRAQALWWSGETLSSELLETLQPEIAIASARTLKPDTIAQLKQHKVQLYWTGRDGAIQWNPDMPEAGFKTTLDLDDDEAFLL